jgi:O-antigen/teichoic acid export membrane protein
VRSSLKSSYARISQSVLARRLLNGAGWGLLAAIATSGFNLATMMFIARLLGKQGYGHLIAIQTTLGLVGVIAGLGLGATATRYVGELKLINAPRLGRILALAERCVIGFGTVASVLLAIIAFPIANSVWHLPELGFPLALAAVSVLVTAMDSYQKSVLIGFEAMRVMAIGNIFASLIALPIVLLLTFRFQLLGASIGIVAAPAIQCVFSRIQMLRVFRTESIAVNSRTCTDEWKVLRDFALPSFLAAMLVVPANWICQAMLVNAPQGFAQLAILGVVMQWFNTVTFLPSIAARTILPVLTEQFTNERHAKAATVLKIAMLANIAVAVPAAGIIGLASPWIMQAYGVEFQSDWATLVLSAFAAVLVVVSMPAGLVLAAGNRMWTGAAMNLGWALIYIGLSAGLVRLGAFGIVLSLTIAYLFHSAWSVIYAIRCVSKSGSSQLIKASH